VQKYGGQPLTRKQFVKAIERIVGKWRATAWGSSVRRWQLSAQAYGQGTGRRLSVLPTLMSVWNRQTADIWSDTALNRTNPQPLATARYIRFVGSKPEAYYF
jgi:hypothetical protein